MINWGELPVWLRVWFFLGLGGFGLCLMPFKFLRPWNVLPRVLIPAALFGSSILALVLYGHLR